MCARVTQMRIRTARRQTFGDGGSETTLEHVSRVREVDVKIVCGQSLDEERHVGALRVIVNGVIPEIRHRTTVNAKDAR